MFLNAIPSLHPSPGEDEPRRLLPLLEDGVFADRSPSQSSHASVRVNSAASTHSSGRCSRQVGGGHGMVEVNKNSTDMSMNSS